MSGAATIGSRHVAAASPKRRSDGSNRSSPWRARKSCGRVPVEGHMQKRTADRLFRLLLRVLPFDFRADHGHEIEQVFRAQRRETRGVRALAGLWIETIQDVLATAPTQHVHVLRQDVGYALRTFRRAPGFTAAAVMTFAIGIGGATSVFTVVNAFLFRPLPVDRPGELVSIA